MQSGQSVQRVHPHAINANNAMRASSATIAMGATEGLKRGLTASRTNAPISVPVGPETLGRIINIIGDPIDERGPINAKTMYPIHRDAPSFSEQGSGAELLITGKCLVSFALAEINYYFFRYYSIC